MKPELMSDALDDLRNMAPLSEVSSSRIAPTPIVTDPGFVAWVDYCTMVFDQRAAAAFMRGVLQARAASERRPYVAVPGAGKRLRQSLHQTGVL